MPITREIKTVAFPSPEKIATLGTARDKVVVFLKGDTSSGDVKGFLGSFGLLIKDRKLLGHESVSAVEGLAGSLRKHDQRLIQNRLASGLTEMVKSHIEELSSFLNEGRLDEALGLTETVGIDRAAALALGLDRKHQQITEGLKIQQSLLDTARKAQKKLEAATTGPASPSKRRFLGKAVKATALVAGTGFLGYKAGKVDATVERVRDDVAKMKSKRENPDPATPNPSPESSTTPIAVPKVEIKLPEVGNYNPEFIRPLMESIVKNREARARNNPESLKRIDPEINKDRVTFVIHNQGESHEPPFDRLLITSTTWISWNLSTGSFDSFSITHDVRVPNAERELKKQGNKDVASQKVDYVYAIGGVKLLSEVVEDITGLYADAVFVSNDGLVVEGIDQVFGTLPVEVPRDFKVLPYWLNGGKYPPGEFKKGVEDMDGKRVLQFIKTMPNIPDYPVELNHNNLKKRVFQSMVDFVGKNFLNEDLWIKLLNFMGDVAKNKKIDSNIEPSVLLETLDHIISNLGRTALEKGKGNFPTPFAGTSTYISDDSRGDGGLNWITAVKETDARVAADLQKGIYPDKATKVPKNADPYAYDNLTGKYWGSTRKLVKDKLTPPKN